MKHKTLILRILDALFAAAFTAWMFLPMLPVTASGQTELLRPFFLPPLWLHMHPLGYEAWALFVIYLILPALVWKILAIFKGTKMGTFGLPAGIPSCLSRILLSAAAVFTTVLPVVVFADRPSWLENLNLYWLVSAPAALLLHFVCVGLFFRVLNLRNPAYREYQNYVGNSRHLSVHGSDGKPRLKQHGFFMEVLFRIRTKLFFAFVGVIALILTTLSMVLLDNYRNTILAAVTDGATSQVEQASTVYRVNLGDTIAMQEYLGRQAELNSNAGFAWRDLTIYTYLRAELYLDEADPEPGEFRAEFSTIEPGKRYPDIPPMSGEQIRNRLPMLAAGQRILSDSNPQERTMSWTAPIIKIDTFRQGDQRIRRERLLGLAVMTFDRDVIMQPYFRTRTLVLVVTALFMYLSVILTYLVGNYIVNPLLFLRMNVRKISDTLSTMIRGDKRVSSAQLVYNDYVNSRDEIKSLSGEINDMVTVIRGIIPYISASTLKQAETGMVSSIQKELTFLFTDIRGFTSMCEGMAPDEVVTVLNRYLDLEAEIILNNHGDIDKFVGDEVMAFFEGENKEENAARAAMQLVRAMDTESSERKAAGLPVISMGIGINTGTVVFGSVGARDRMDFTSIGDTVNLAARLESANKAYGTRSLVSETVYSRIKDIFLCREIDAITVKGKQKPVRIFEILAERSGASTADEQKKKLFEKGLSAYRKRDWKTAGADFRACVDSCADEPARVFLDRVTHFSANPPDEKWDGVFRMLVK